MKRTTCVYAFMLLAAVTVLSCRKNGPDLNTSSGDLAFDTTLTPIKLSELKEMYNGADITLGETKIFGVVISDILGKNLFQNEHTIIIQQDSTGIAIPLEDYGYKNWQLLTGDSLIINTTGGVLTRRNGTLQVTGIKRRLTQVIGIDRHLYSGNLIPRQLTLAQLQAGFSRYENTLVKVTASITPAGKYSGDKTLDDGSSGHVQLHTNAHAVFADSTMPAKAGITGIAIRVNTSGNDTAGAVKQLWPRNLADIK